MTTDNAALKAALNTPIRTASQLYEFWRALMGPLGFSERLLWVQLLAEDGLPIRQIVQIDDLPTEPDTATCRSLMEVCSTVLASVAPQGSVAILLSRPGRDGMRDDDRRWAHELSRAGATGGVRLWPVHLATDRQLQVFAPDDLLPMAG